LSRIRRAHPSRVLCKFRKEPHVYKGGVETQTTQKRIFLDPVDGHVALRFSNRLLAMTVQAFWHFAKVEFPHCFQPFHVHRFLAAETI
jgi:hypothetical protein